MKLIKCPLEISNPKNISIKVLADPIEGYDIIKGKIVIFNNFKNKRINIDRR